MIIVLLSCCVCLFVPFLPVGELQHSYNDAVLIFSQSIYSYHIGSFVSLFTVDFKPKVQLSYLYKLFESCLMHRAEVSKYLYLLHFRYLLIHYASNSHLSFSRSFREGNQTK